MKNLLKQIEERASALEGIIRQAWSQKQVFFQDKRISFDQDYSPEDHVYTLPH